MIASQHTTGQAITHIAVVTGASTGIGRSFAHELARGGRGVLLTALPDSGLPSVARELSKSFGVPVEYVETDLTQRTGIEGIIESAYAMENRGMFIDFLVNNAGIGCPGAFSDTTCSGMESVVDLNIRAVVSLTRRLLPLLQRSAGSTIINVASLASFYPMPEMAVYAASKSFVLNFTLALREELRNSGTNVTALCPSGVATNEDTTARLNAQGFVGRLVRMRPDDVVAQGLHGASQSRAIVVPGLLNKILRLLGAYAPRLLITRLNGIRFRKTIKRARRTASQADFETV